jgi:hypothetical protein
MKGSSELFSPKILRIIAISSGKERKGLVKNNKFILLFAALNMQMTF